MKYKYIILLLSLVLVSSIPLISLGSIETHETLESLNEVLPSLRGNNAPNSQPEIKEIHPTSAIMGFFPEPTVEILTFTDHEMDLLGYGNDTLRFSMEFLPFQTAYYSGYAYLFTNNSANREELVGGVHWGESLVGGTIRVATFDFCAYHLNEQGINGPYAIYLEFYKDNGSGYTIYSTEHVHTTKSYLAAEFLASPVVPGTISINFVDNDLNGKNEWIDVIIPVTVTIPGKYRFEGEIQDSFHGYSDSSQKYPTLNIGTSSVTLRFNGWIFNKIIGSSTIKFTYLFIRHDSYPHYSVFSQWNDFYESSTVFGSDFDVFPIVFTGKYVELAVDTDSNGFYDKYRIIAEVERLRVELGSVQINGDLYQNTSMNYITNTWLGSIELTSIGKINVTFEFNGLGLYLNGIINDYLLLKNFYGYFYHNDGNWADYGELLGSYISSRRYNYTEFEGPGASLTDNFIATGLDTDSDGLYNYLIVSVEINVIKAGNYYISSWIDKASTGADIAYASNSSYLSVGFQWMTLKYDGSEFFHSGLNESIKFEYLYISDSTGYTLDTNNTAILGTFIFTQFDPPKIKLTGIYSDSYYDSDSDGYWDGLRVFVEVEVNQSSRYRIIGSLENPLTGDSIGVQSEPALFGTGTISVELNFPANWIWRQRANTTYILSYIGIIEVDDNDDSIRYWDEKWDVYITNMTDSAKFEHPRAYFTGNFQETRIDRNSDGRYEFLRISVEIYASELFQVELAGDMDTETDWMYLYNSTTLVPGYQYIDLDYYTPTLYQPSGIKKYRVNFYLYDQTVGESLDSYPEYYTNQYPCSEWKVPGILPTGRIFDKGVDLDSNGKFDYLELRIEFTVSLAGTYHIYGYLRATEGMNDYYFSWGYTYIGIGTFNITFEIDRSWVRNQPDGTSFYIDYLRIYEEIIPESYTIYKNYDDKYLSKVYYYYQFDLPDAWVLGIIDNFGVDYNDDTLFDTWAVVFQVNVTKTEVELYLEASLESQSSGYWLADSSVVVYSVTKGILNITLEFNGMDLYNSGFSGVVVISYYRLMENQNWQLLDENWDRIPLSNLYEWSDFTPTPPSYVRIVEISPVGNSIFLTGETIDLYVTVEFMDQWINSVQVNILIDGTASQPLSMNYYSSTGNQEIWRLTITFDEGQIWEITITAYGSESSDSQAISYYLIGAPYFYDFTVNISSVTIGGTVHFEVEVWDLEGISTVLLYVSGNSYVMEFLGNGTYGEVYAVDVTFQSVGIFTAYVDAINIHGLSTKSFDRQIYVNEGSEIISVTVTPSNSIELGDPITFTVVIRKSDAIVTSVDVEDKLEDSIYALERSFNNTETETWTVTYTPTKAGQHICTLTVLNTRNQVSNAEEIFKVTGGTEINVTPGFEFFVPLFILVLLPYFRKRR